MRLTTFTDYSLRVLMYLAAHPGRRARIAELAQAFGMAENHVVKVVHFLGRAGWLVNVRGHGGGTELACDPVRIGIGAVVRATEGAPVLAACFADSRGDCAIAPACRLRGVLDEALTAFYAALDRYSHADLVTHRQQLARMLLPTRDTTP